MGDSEALLKELLETFRLEAQHHMGALSTLLIKLESETGETERGRLAEGIFRRMHTLKGAAHAVNLLDVARGCQDLESLLADLKRGDLSWDLGLFDRLHADIDLLAARIFAPSAAGLPEAGHPKSPLSFPEAGGAAAFHPGFEARPPYAASGPAQPSDEPARPHWSAPLESPAAKIERREGGSAATPAEAERCETRLRALESSAERERGIDVGADAYVVKSSFDQSSLIEVIQKQTSTGYEQA